MPFPRLPNMAAVPRLIASAALVVVTLLGLWPSAAVAWPEDVHAALLLRSLGDRVDHGALVLPEPQDVVGFYGWLAHALAGAREPDPDGRERFFALYPEARTFDAIGARRFFGLTADPNVEVYGISNFDRDAELDRYDVLLLASSTFHRDRRFRQPIRHDHVHAPMRLRDGSPIPDDPQTLHFGPLEGAGSDEWARSALPADAIRTDEAALHEAPALFVAPVSAGVEVAGGGARMAQIHADLALLAVMWGGMELKVAGDYFAMVWLGNALGLVLDLGSPFAASQIGGPAVWDAAGKAHVVTALRTAGGVLGVLPSRAYLASRIRYNARIVGERLIGAAILAELDRPGTHPEAKALLDGLRDDDPAFLATLQAVAGPWLEHDGKRDPFGDDGGAALLGVRELARASTETCADAYAAVVPLLQGRWADGSELITDSKAPLATFLRDPEGAEVALARRTLLQLAAPGLRRAATLDRELYRAWDSANGRTALGRLRQGGLRHLEDRTARGLDWKQGGVAPVGGFGAERRPWIAGVYAFLVLAGLFWLVRRTRR